MKTLTATIAAIGLLCSFAAAGPIQAKTVAGDAKWAVHVNVEGLIGSDVGKFILGEVAKAPDFEPKLTAFKKAFGFDPLKAVRSVTLYGKDYASKDGAMVVDATVDQAALMELLQANAAYKKAAHGKHVVHQWAPNANAAAKPAFGCFYDKNTIVVAGTVGLLETALDVLDGKAASLAKTNALPLPAKPAGTALITASANEIKLPEGKKARAMVLQSLVSGRMQLSESGGKMHLNISTKARTDEVATDIRQLAQGFAALVSMMKQQEKFAHLRDLGETVTIGGTGPTATLDVSMPSGSMIKLIRHAHEARKAARGRRHGRRRKADDDKPSDE